MEKLDPKMEAQIWQRVIGKPQPTNEQIRPLLLMAWESVGVYRQLMGQLTGKKQERMKQLHERSARAVDCLLGIQTMSGIPSGKLRPQPVPKESARRLLEKSYHRSLRLMTEYAARVAMPEFGTVYQHLWDWEKETCAVLAELIGGLERQ